MGDLHHLPAPGREFFLGDDGSVLRATWHVELGLVNLSIWRGDRCTETFRIPTADAARLIAFLAGGPTQSATPEAGASTADIG